MRSLPKIRVGRARKHKPILPSPIRPRADTGEEAEVLGGVVQNKKASAPEERFFGKTLPKLPSVDSFEFRYTIGAPRGLPGWKELDGLVSARGILYAIEVDTEFTHRQKARADVLHDAIVLKDLEKLGMEVYPQVIHLDGESDLVDQKWSDITGKRLFG